MGGLTVLVGQGVLGHKVELLGNFVKQVLLQVGLARLIQTESEGHLRVGEQRRLVFLDDPQQVLFYFGDSLAQVTFQHELCPLHLHLQDVGVEAVVRVCRLVALKAPLLACDCFADCVHECLLVRKQVWRHFLVVEQLNQLGKFGPQLTVEITLLNHLLLIVGGGLAEK